MNKKDSFIQEIQKSYTNDANNIYLGAGMLQQEVFSEARVSIPLSTLNRHGLVAGATGTGKTKTIQKLTELFSSNGIASLVMDMKGDFSGIAKEGEQSPKIEERVKKLKTLWKPQAFPVEFLSLSHESGVRVRSTISEFGPVLFSRILGLNDTQSSVVSMVFKYCDDNGLLLLDLKDFKKALQYLTTGGKNDIEKEYGRISTASTATIMRKLIELEEQGGEELFGEPSFDVSDLLEIDKNGRGIIHIVRLASMQGRPKLFSTYILALLSEIYNTFPEVGDESKPKLMVCIDEAHLVFSDASSALLEKISTIIKLIRSKGVGILFCTQNPTDIPPTVLSQLGLKIQHALRAFTAADRRAIKLTAENYPTSSYYETQDTITQLGIGEAFVTGLSIQGTPTPLVRCYMSPPESRMDILTTEEFAQLASSSRLLSKYNTPVERESAYEILQKNIIQKTNTDLTTQNTDDMLQKAVKSPVGKLLMQQTKLVIGQLIRSHMRNILGTIGGKNSNSKKYY